MDLVFSGPFGALARSLAVAAAVALARGREDLSMESARGLLPAVKRMLCITCARCREVCRVVRCWATDPDLRRLVETPAFPKEVFDDLAAFELAGPDERVAKVMMMAPELLLESGLKGHGVLDVETIERCGLNRVSGVDAVQTLAEVKRHLAIGWAYRKGPRVVSARQLFAPGRSYYSLWEYGHDDDEIRYAIVSRSRFEAKRVLLSLTGWKECKGTETGNAEKGDPDKESAPGNLQEGDVNELNH